MQISEYVKFDGLGLAELVKNRDVTPLELVDTAIARAEAVNPSLNFLVHRDYDRARETARAAQPSGVFAGVPFFLKDILAFAVGMPTRQAARFIPAVPFAHDSLITTRFRAAGLIPLGKTNVPEYGLLPTTESRLYGPAHNPFGLGHSTGGSSGGSAAAVAAGVVPLAHANDGGGSIRIPASCCGLVGLKPTRARVSLAPDLGEAVDGLAIDHVLTRSVRDCAAALDAIAGNLPGDPYWAPPSPKSWLSEIESPPRQLRIAYSVRRLDGGAFHADCEKALRAAVKLCEELGHETDEAAPHFDLSVLVPSFMALWTANLAAAVDFTGKVTGQTPSEDLFEGLTWGMYEEGKRVSASQYLLAKAALQHASRGVAKFHDSYDIWLTPTLGKPPMKLGTLDIDERDVFKGFLPLFDYVPFTALQNVTGQPAINLPIHWNADGLPIGLQFVAPFGDELTLLQLAAQIERAAPWSHHYSLVKV